MTSKPELSPSGPAATPDPGFRDGAPLPCGTRFGEIEILRVLAVGGFGIVYLGRDHALDREVAVKEYMPAQLAGRSGDQRVTLRPGADASTYALGLQAFVDEARRLARLTHPAVVRVHRFWKANGTGYMVMPHLRGPTLSDVRRSMSEPPKERWLRAVLEPLLDALAMLHAEGCYHRDISPDNVLVLEGGMPVLLDFGAAGHPVADDARSPTAILKPRYSPIEQYAQSRHLEQGPWTDLYSIGALLEFLIEGVPPAAAPARAVRDDRRPLAGRQIPGISASFLAAVDWALEVLPQDRPQSVAQVRDALAGRRRVPAPGRDARPEAGAREPAPRPMRGLPARLRALPVPLRALSARAAIGLRAITRGQRWAAAACVMVASAGSGLVVSQSPGGVLAAAHAESVPLASPGGTAAARTAAPTLLAAAEDLAEPPATTPPPPPVAQRPAAAPAVAERSAAAPSNAAPRKPAAAEQVARRPPSQPGARAASKAPTKTASAAKKPKRVAAGNAPAGGRIAGMPTARSRGPGPLQMCADRLFFVRPFCVQRLCDERRFRGHPQCTPERQVARGR